MNKDFKRTVLLMSIFLMYGLAYSGSTWAASSHHAMSVEQQKQTVKGVVNDNYGAVIGASVIEKGNPSNGVITDFDGNFEISVNSGATIVISYIGYKSQEIVINGQTELNILLESDAQDLEEVVVVGYGVQKKKLVTGATVQVKGDDIAKLNTTSALTALQGQTPGVNITASNGQPGEGFKVNIRGMGTIGDSEPLYVIDGVAGGDINTLNPADIETIDVLKDAASAAIYGSRAANGVILITTKQGKSGKISISYDGYVGIQNAYKMPQLLSAQQMMALTDESRYMEGVPVLDWKTQLGERVYNMIQNGWQGSNFLEEIRVKNAITHNHALNLAGGTDLSKFSAGFSYTKQNGIFGKPVASTYNRYTARLNSSHVLVKGKEHDILRFGENLTFYYSTKTGIAQLMNGYNDIQNSIKAMPILPVYNANGGLYSQADKEADGWIYSNEEANPILPMANETGNNLNRSYGLNATAYLDFEPIKGLRYHTSFSYKNTSITNRSLTIPYTASTNKTSDSYTVTQNSSVGHKIAFENTLTYMMPTMGKWNLEFIIGQSFEKTTVGEDLSITNSALDGTQLPTMKGDMDHAWITNTTNALNGTSISGKPWPDWSLLSFFGRWNVNYDEKYMATFIIRTDGSSNFARGHRWGTFPSVSAGWVISSEKFMEKTRSWLDFLKLRASWGKNGNQSISNFQYLSPVAFDPSSVYNFGQTILNTTGTKNIGAYATTLANENVTWETSQQFDLGIDARFINGRLGLAFDWYNKSTKDWLLQAPILDTAGTGAPFINGGDVENKGFEVALSWNDQIGSDFRYGVNLNLSYNKNEVTRIANPEGIIHGDAGVLSKTSNEFYRAQVGFPIGYFWGYQTAGVFQNQTDIDNWVAAGNGLASGNPRPGDIIYVDANHDGKIDETDKTMIGDPNPDFRLGFSLNMGYKGFDFGITTTGAFGHQIYFGYRKNTTYALDRWHGEGTSNRYGVAVLSDDVTDLNLENADYLRIQNITLGYDFKQLVPKMPFSKARLYVSAQNLFTFTSYKGLDPEVGFGGNNLYGQGNNWMTGVDLGSYPSPRTFLVGINLSY